MRKNKHIYSVLAALILLLSASPIFAKNSSASSEEELNVKEFILEHLADSYEWHIVGNGEKVISVPLPVILYSKISGWHFYSSSRFHRGKPAYDGFQIAAEGKYKGKIVETDASGNVTRPLDLSLTKNAYSHHHGCGTIVKAKPAGIKKRFHGNHGDVYHVDTRRSDQTFRRRRL